VDQLFGELLSPHKLHRTGIVLQIDIQEITFHANPCRNVKIPDIAMLQRFRRTGSPGSVGDLNGNLITSQCVYPVRNSSPAIAGLETERGIISNGVNLSAEFNATTGFTHRVRAFLIIGP
jgi:hypothetical protein